MPNILNKLFHHKKTGSHSSSRAPSPPASPESPARDRRGSMPSSPRQEVAAGVSRKSMDSPRRRERDLASSPPTSPPHVHASNVVVNPARSAPPPPTGTTGAVGVPVVTDDSLSVNESRDTERPLPSLPSLPHVLPPLAHLDSSDSNHQVKDVEGRRSFPAVNSAGPMYSVQGELGRGDEQGYISPADVPPRGSSLGHDVVGMNHGANSLEGDSGLSSRLRGLTLNAKSADILPHHKQTAKLVEEIHGGAKTRRASRGELSAFGQQTWEKAGWKDRIGQKDTVEVETKWLPVVTQEIIIPRVHTEYTTLLRRDIHKHHYYPKIQPIEDPEPIVLPPRHRIFSPATGKWHEVIGDDAAREILGEETFKNGPKEQRNIRKIATDSGTIHGNLLDESALRGEAASANARGAGRIESFIDGLSEEEMLAQGFGTGGRGKVVEREWIDGAESKPDWKKVVRGHIFGRHEEHQGVKERVADGEVGVAM